MTLALLNGSGNKLGKPTENVSNKDTSISDTFIYLLNIFVRFSGPKKSVFSSENSSVTNVTQLTKGDYLFQLTVYDENENTASAFVGVTVNQSKFGVRNRISNTFPLILRISCLIDKTVDQSESIFDVICFELLLFSKLSLGFYNLYVNCR